MLNAIVSAIMTITRARVVYLLELLTLVKKRAVNSHPNYLETKTKRDWVGNCKGSMEVLEIIGLLFVQNYYDHSNADKIHEKRDDRFAICRVLSSSNRPVLTFN